MTVPGDLLDLILLVLAAAFAVAGYRQGFIIGVLSFAGFVGGAFIGTVIAPSVSTFLSSQPNVQAVLGIVTVFVIAVLGMLGCSAAAVRLRSRVRRRPATVLDSLGGAVVNVVAILLLAWIIGTVVAYAPPFPALASEVNGSIVLRTVDRVIPHDLRPTFTSLRQLLITEPYAQVFGALGAETALNVPSPVPAVLHSPGLYRDRNSIVKVEGIAPECGRTIEGSGFAITPDHIVTNAHVVAGVREGLTVYTRQSATGYPATVVVFDPLRDVAVLYVPGLQLRPLHLGPPAAFGANAIIVGYPENGPFTAVPARVGRAEAADGPDIYQTTQVQRDVYPVRALVRPGNSGGPLLATDGQVYGLVFAAATSIPNTGYALTGNEISGDISRGSQATTSVSTRGCQ